MLLTSSNSWSQPSLQWMRSTPLPYFKNLTALEYHDKTVMAIGNDATRIMLLNRQHKMLDTLQLFDYNNRPAKGLPPGGIQATAVITLEEKPVLLIMGSGQPRTDKSDIWLFPLQNRRFTEVYIPSFAISGFFQRMQKAGIRHINIEGATAIGKQMVLANGASQIFKDNYLVLTEYDFWSNTSQVNMRLVKLDMPTPGMSISGLEYDRQQDVLLFTAMATEDSKAPAAKSPVIGVVRNASSRVRSKTLQPDYVFDLTATLPDTSHQALQSICLEDDKSDTGTSVLHVCTTDATGKSSLHKLQIIWN